MTRDRVVKSVGVAVGGSGAAAVAISSTVPGIIIGIASGIAVAALAIVALSAARAKNPITQKNSFAVLRLLVAAVQGEPIAAPSSPKTVKRRHRSASAARPLAGGGRGRRLSADDSRRCQSKQESNTRAR